jgi:hypothetical protein
VKCPLRRFAMRWLLLPLLLFASVSAIIQPAQDDEDAEWGIFAALRSVESAADTSFEQCNCCQDFQDLRSRVAALEHHIAQSSKLVLRTSFASRCPSPPSSTAAHAAADFAAPTLSRMTASYCSEWVRFPLPRQFHNIWSRIPPLYLHFSPDSDFPFLQAAQKGHGPCPHPQPTTPAHVLLLFGQLQCGNGSGDDAGVLQSRMPSFFAADV